MSRFEEYLMKERYKYISIYEILIALTATTLFCCGCWKIYKFVFVACTIIIYWFYLRYIESSILLKKQEIYNVPYENHESIPMDVLEGKLRSIRKPLEYDLEQLKLKRKFIVDKFIIVNLILTVLLQF